MVYSLNGVPCSDELYHHGILGQKWGVRRYQNPDGTLTAAGKIHYAAAKTGEAIGSAAKKVANKISTNYKNKHPNMLTDEELQARMNRISMENRYRDMLRENQKPISRGSQMAQDILERSGKDIASGLVNLSTSILREKAMNAIRSESDEEQYRRDQKREELRYLRDQQREEARYQRGLQRNESEYQRDQKRRASEDRKQYQTELLRKKAADAEAKREFENSVVGKAQKDFDDWFNSERDSGRPIDPTERIKTVSDFSKYMEDLYKIHKRDYGNNNQDGQGKKRKKGNN